MSSKYKGDITYDVYIKNKFRSNKKIFYYLGDIKNSIKKYNLEKKGTKKELESRLFDFFELLYYHQKNNITYITKLQKRFRINKNKNKIKTQGIGIIDKSLCVNHEDFYSFENINEIDDNFFFSYEKNGKVFYFDIRSLRKLLKHSKINPYTQEEIPDYAINAYLKRRIELKNKGISVIIDAHNDLSPEQQFNAYVLDVFQKIDDLNIVAGGVDIKWFLELNSQQLKMYYKILEDIWNYRANLDIISKKLIVPDNDVFRISVHEVYTINNNYKRKLQNILLYNINKLVSSSPDNVHRGTGGYFVLTGLVEISSDCASALPWLIQYT